MGSYGTNNTFGRTGRLMLLALAVGTFMLSAVGAARNERATHGTGPGCISVECVATNETTAKTLPLNTATEMQPPARELSAPASASHHR